MGIDDGAKQFCGVQPGCHIIQDARETYVIFCVRLGRRGEVDVYPTTELDARALVRAKRDWQRSDSW